MIRSLKNGKQKRIEKLVSSVLGEIPFLETDDPNLIDTPERIARMYLDVFWGLDPGKKPKMKTFPLDGDCGMVGTGKIFFTSFCSHHLLPFHGHASIFYMPKGHVAGLSKFTRVVQYYAARPQIQERLAVQIADHIMEAIKPYGVYVVLSATHGCMMARGVRQERAKMVTPVIRPLDKLGNIAGPFAMSDVRQEALSLLDNGSV